MEEAGSVSKNYSPARRFCFAILYHLGDNYEKRFSGAKNGERTWKGLLDFSDKVSRVSRVEGVSAHLCNYEEMSFGRKKIVWSDEV